MAKHDAHIIDGICELLWENVADLSPRHVVRGTTAVDIQARVIHTSFLVAQSFLPAALRDHIDTEVEKQVTAFYADLGVVCKPVEDPKWGRCFELDLPGKLVGFSWDEFLNR